VRSLFGAFGFEVRDYSSAEAFLERFCGARPGCVIAEERLDGMTGVQLQERLQALGVALPVIIMTSNVDSTLSHHATQTGVLALIQKPFVDRILLDSVQKTLGFSES
jgi:FixJ family two-component response regulator